MINLLSGLYLYRLMVPVFINEYLNSGACNLHFQIEEKSEQKLWLNLVLNNKLMNILIAGSFG